MLDDQSDAEDIVGESFIRIWERHTLFSHPQVIKSWLYTTVRNGCLSHLHKEKNNQINQEQLAKYREDDYETFILQEIIRAEFLRELYEHIESLPRSCRKIFQMLYIQGKTVREIAEELQISVSTIKNQKVRGVGLLRKRFPDLSILVILDLLNRLC